MTSPQEPASSPQEPADAPPSATSRLFDLRTVIAVLFGFYGLVLTVMGLFFEAPDELAKSGGIDINLWTGLVMLVIAVLFVVWARQRPLAPPEERP